jgi:Domain of Unknown Function (DUF1080)
MTHRRSFLAATGGAVAWLAGCSSLGSGAGWTTLVDGTKVPGAAEGWTSAGEGNWSVAEGTLQGKEGKMGYLVTKDSYTDFEIRAEFWADASCNSGIFIRCQDRTKVGANNSYEVNIFDKRPDPSYGTGAIVDVAKVRQPGPMAVDRWNTFEITAKGERLVVVLNGEKTVDVMDAKWKSGPVALQSAGGTIRFRKVQIRTL